MRQRVRINVGLAIATAIAFVAVFSSSTFAQTTGTATNSSANVIKISPLRTDIQVAAGGTGTVKITISNPTASSIQLTPIENDFVAADETGNPALILDANTFAPTHSLKRFLAPLSDVTVPAASSKTISVTITVPKGAQASGYFGAIRFAPSSGDSGGQVNLSANAASLILLTVPGPATEQLNLTDFVIQQNGKTGTFFNTPNNLKTLIRFENKGNLQEGPFGVISVKKNGKVISESQFNTDEPRDVILPDGARRWEVALKNIGTFGHYSVTANLTYGLQNTSVEVTKSFWVVPMSYLIGAAIAVVIFIGLVILVIILIRRSRNRRSRRRGLGGYRR